MKFKQQKNRKTKSHIKFDKQDRKDYLLGFRKRKLERQKKAKEQMVEQYKKEKKELKKKRIDYIKNLLTSEKGNLSSDGSDDDGDTNAATPVVTDYGNCTVEVSDLNLQNNSLRANQVQEKPATKPTTSRRSSKPAAPKKSLLKLPTMENVSSKVFKRSLWRSASKTAKKEFNSEKKKKKKKKVLVTEL